MLTPPEGYGTVEDGIYRCSFLSPLHFAFLETLGLHSLIVLNLDRPSKPVLRYCTDKRVTLIHMGLRPWRPTSTDWMVLDRELLTDALTYVLDSRHHPVLVLDATNAFIGALRRAQHWNFASVLSEYRAFAGEKPHYLTELFLELLDIRFLEYWEAKKRRSSVKGMAVAAAAAAEVAAAAGPPGDLLAATKTTTTTTTTVAGGEGEGEGGGEGTVTTIQQTGSANLLHSPLQTGRTQRIKLHRSMPSEDQFSNIISNHPQNNHIVVILPPLENLAEWFNRQRRLWERDVGAASVV